MVVHEDCPVGEQTSIYTPGVTGDRETKTNRHKNNIRTQKGVKTSKCLYGHRDYKVTDNL